LEAKSTETHEDVRSTGGNNCVGEKFFNSEFEHFDVLKKSEKKSISKFKIEKNGK